MEEQTKEALIKEIKHNLDLARVGLMDLDHWILDISTLTNEADPEHLKAILEDVKSLVKYLKGESVDAYKKEPS